MGKVKKYIFIQEELLGEIEATGKGSINADNQLTLVNGVHYQLSSSVRFLEEITGEGDPDQLIGLVLSMEELIEKEYEFSVDSVIVGERVYLVEEGFKGIVMPRVPKAVLKKEIAQEPEKQSDEQKLGSYILSQMK